MSAIRIGNACGFWGDSPAAPLRLATEASDLDVLTLDYLAEVSMSILARQNQRDPSLGYPKDLLEVIGSLAPLWASGRKLKLVTNGGGLNPRGCAEACAAILRQAGCKLRIGIVSGDDVAAILRQSPDEFKHLDTGESLDRIADSLVTANAYLGAAPIAAALSNGADIVITGRVADPSLTVGPCLAHFGWNETDFNKIAGATVAGHLIECGTQVTGGISTHWLEMDNMNVGYPIAEIETDGGCIMTKPRGSGGEVSERTVKEQLLYEIGDPARYLSPDATVSFLSLKVHDRGNDRVAVVGAIGSPPPDSYKVSATYSNGWQAVGMLTIIGHRAVAKARRCGEVVIDKLVGRGIEPAQWRVECLGSEVMFDHRSGPSRVRSDPACMETVLRIAAWDARREVIEAFSREIVPLVTAGPQGTTGYFDARPKVKQVFGYWPTLIARDRVTAVVEYLET